MCRSIRTLRPPHLEEVHDGDVVAAARQYVRKVSGFRDPSDANRDVFDDAIARITEATTDLLESLDVRGREPVVVVPGAEQKPVRRPRA
ncbi:DUF2277 domain-containing protein [Salsipaludibacter albus]|uniref:DUF2277 domain-containing protein n=1 Tax=Salsipaludibacter albus TaxID=2849650 RepID=UPI001EE43E1D|nr:DUF2277 domain-containing protein [Salsipaludibacter albus]MBY5164018.1 DUF2277 domain-containing protein [Salsipaludibacter albus]